MFQCPEIAILRSLLSHWDMPLGVERDGWESCCYSWNSARMAANWDCRWDGVGDMITARFSTQRKEEASQTYWPDSLAFKDVEMY